VYGTYNDGTTSQVTSGVSWSSGSPSVADFTTPTSNVLQGLSFGTSTITANAQAVTATASATVYLGGITAMTVSPTSANLTGTGSQPFTFAATANGATVDITTDNGGTITITPANADLTCVAEDPQEVCSLDGGQSTTQTQQVTMSYPGTTITASATVTTGP
jgi:trimeric autotransporter adhesin